MIVLGLTGSIGMGKSTTARMFAEAGVPVHDSDEAVHRLYSGKAAPLIEEAFPGSTRAGVVDRGLLGQKVLGNPDALRRLEGIVHPLVREDAEEFLEHHRKAGSRLVVLDIPLLFETGGRDRVDKVVVVTASPEIQQQRVLERPGMTEEKFRSILTKQMPDDEKRSRANYIIDTGKGMDAARSAVAAIIEDLYGLD